MSRRPGRSDPHASPRRMRLVWIATAVAIAVIVVAAVAWNQSHHRHEQIDRRLRSAQTALRSKNFARAAEHADAILAWTPNSPEALLIAGQAATAQKRNSEALDFLRRVPVDDTKTSQEAQFSLGELALRLGRATEAEGALRNVLKNEPQHPGANYLLAFLLGVECRAWESLPYVENLVRQQRCDVPHLLLCGMPEEFFIDQKEFQSLCRSAVPDDPLPRLVEVRLALMRNDRDEARRVLQEILAQRPDSLEAQSCRGRQLIDDRDPAFLEWNAKLSPAADAFPDIWMSRGRWLVQVGEARGAVRCFREALRLNPNHLAANRQMAQALESLSLERAARPFAKRATRLGQLFVPLRLVDQQRDPHLIRRIVELLDSLGRPWESAAWCRIALRYNSQLTWPKQRLDELALELQPDTPTTLTSHNPTHGFDIADFPLPRFERGTETNPAASPR